MKRLTWAVSGKSTIWSDTTHFFGSNLAKVKNCGGKKQLWEWINNYKGESGELDRLLQTWPEISVGSFYMQNFGMTISYSVVKLQWFLRIMHFKCGDVLQSSIYLSHSSPPLFPHFPCKSFDIQSPLEGALFIGISWCLFHSCKTLAGLCYSSFSRYTSC